MNTLNTISLDPFVERQMNSAHDALDLVERQGANSPELASAHEMLKIKATKVLTAPGLTGTVSATSFS